MDESQKHYAEWKKPDTENNTLWVRECKFLRTSKTNLRQIVKNNHCLQRWWVGGTWLGGSMKELSGKMKMSYDKNVGFICQNTTAKIHCKWILL